MAGPQSFSSNTLAAAANQCFFESDGTEVLTSRIYFKIFASGEYNYRLCFSGVHDSSYRRISLANQRCDSWKIHSVRVSRCESFPDGIEPSELNVDADLIHGEWVPLTFDGGPSVSAIPDLFYTDAVRLFFNKGDFICVEISYSGERIPYHPEITIPVYRLTPSGWEYNVSSPLPCAVQCDRPIKGTVAFLGDSITQGCDTGVNDYAHWCAKLADMLGEEYAYHNLGIGCGKASDAASDSIWLDKARVCDTVFVCFGVNDVNGDYTAQSIKRALRTIVRRLKEDGCRVILQTVPPYDHEEPRRTVWCEVNKYIIEELSCMCDRLFDVRRVLSVSESEPHLTRFGGHPSPEGCALWADALYETVRDMF